MKNLDEIRKGINAIDTQMAKLFEQRMELSREVFGFKKEKGLPINDPVREADVIARTSQLIEDDEIKEYFIRFQQGMMDLSKDYQSRLMRGMKVSYCGVPGAFASIAAARMFPEAEFVPFPDFEGAYNACSEGLCDAAVLPFENSFAGEVSAVTDLMFSGNLYVNQVMEIEVLQNLVACEGASLEGIKEVVSHPQAISQCSRYLKEKGYIVHEYPNTAAAAKMVAARNDPSVAAIASAEAAELYGLKLIDRNINSSTANTTRFAAFSRVLNSEKSRKKTGRHFILMFTVKNEAGSLAKTLNIIGAHNYNMSNLRSRPMKGLMWNYYFFIELEGNLNSEEGRSMMIELGTLCDRLKIVGVF